MKREPYIKELIANKGYKTIAEIGVLRGWFANHLYQTQPNELVLVDPWKRWSTDVFEDYDDYPQEKWDLLHDQVKAKFSKQNVRIVRDVSVSASQQFPNGYFDLVYIDGNHKHEYVLEDLEAWMPKVRKGGTLCGHDWQIVTSAVNQFCEKHGLQVNHVTSEKSTASYFISI